MTCPVLRTAIDPVKATVKRVAALKDGGYKLTLSIFSLNGERIHAYRVSEEAYCEAGSPEEGETLPQEIYLPLVKEEDARLAYERALRILASGDNTARALLRKLRERGFGEEAARLAVERVRAQGYVKENEMLLRQLAIYAKRLWGPKKFLPALLSKGFSREEIEQALSEAQRTGVYRKDAVRAELLERYQLRDSAEERALLYKFGF